jgi:4-hydroxy-3-methylbut-2-enyl diphosphate reductase
MEAAMADLTIAVPLLAERVALGRVDARVVRIGMGPHRAAQAIADLPGTGPVAVVGVAGALTEGLNVGDVVVADEVRDGDDRFPCPGAPLVAGALRRAGLTVHVGPIATVDRLAGHAARQSLAATGAIAVDMESAAVAAAVTGRPFVAVRVISDTPAHGVWHPGIVPNGIRALRGLRRIPPTLHAWAAATADRRVLVASPRSFCAGVERAIDIVERALDRYGAPVYVRRQIVHNAHVVADLEAKGAIFVEECEEVPEGARLVFAAHGVSPDVRAQADARHLAVIDATCPLVAKVHTEVRRYAGQGRTVFLIGHADHEEVAGTAGEAPESVVVLDDVATAQTVDVADPERVAYVMQTTLAVDEAADVASALLERFPRMRAPRQDDICYATSNRQAAVRDIAGDCDLVLVIGSANSSNSVRLVEVARRSGAASYLVDDVTDIDFSWLLGARRVGVTAGASAPPVLVDRMVHALTGLGAVAASERTTTTENVTFTLPREVS